MKKTLVTSACFLATIIFFASCVTNRRYVSQKNRVSELQTDNAALNSRIHRLSDTVSSLHDQMAALGNSRDNTANELSKSNNELYKTNNELNMSKDQIAAQRTRLQQLQTLISQQQKATEDLRKKMVDALKGFNSNELTVYLKDGRVYISMEEDLLFPSGSAKVNPRGKEALAKVSDVLNANHDINIDIEGHTDNQPIHTAIYPDNWTLSTARATSIAHVMIDEYSVSPERLIASGRSYYHPLASNDTKDGRRQNRRSEIILEPKYDELMQLMNPATVKN